SDMQVFVEVAKLGSLSAAARKLGLAISVVSERIASLEARFGVKLLVRTTRRQSLTDAGQTWLAHCERLLADFLMAEQA
ncbi:LysR family transcriptional regulator, partial [Cupriavidus sp. SIMBA_020]|uniref:LysR family transcriptional regulator n=1 Tax=Cupriavidus sp. SIMBA_020 TaxID=3085766 RepID=UPI003979DDA4